MDQERWERIKPILSAALERPAGERAALLANACADDTSLRSDVESLIAAHDGAGAFIDTPVLSILSSAPTAGSTASSRAGLRIGPYQVIRELGHGGMGVVFLAT